jgi:general secretion pathway protein J
MIPEHRSRGRGFTLIEVLVATTLLTMMVGLITGSLFSLTRGAQEGHARLDSVDSDRLILSFLRAQISGAVPLTEVRERQQRVYFEGLSNSIRFVGHLPAHRGGGGLQFLQVDADDRFTTSALTLNYRNAWPEVPFERATDSNDWQRTLLMRQVSGVRFRYFGSDDEEQAPVWSDSWVDRSNLPSLVEVTIESTDGRTWPAISIAVRTPTAEGQPRLASTARR